MQTAPTSWLDTETLKPKYGLKVLHEGRWKNLAEDGKPCIYDTETERDAKRAEYRKIQAPSNDGNQR